MKKLYVLLLLALSNILASNVYAADLAVMLYTTEQEGNDLFDKYLKDMGFKRKLKLDAKKNFEYHVTLGYIKYVNKNDVEALKKQISSAMVEKIKASPPVFEYGASALLGKGRPFIVAIPKNSEPFTTLNRSLSDILEKYKDGEYRLSSITTPENYIPHLSLNAKVHQNIKLIELPDILQKLNKKMAGAKINVVDLVIN
jgi:hypothetical protein